MSIIPLEMGQISRSAISLPGGFARAVRLREMALAASLDVPRYLLAPEIAVLLDYLPDLRQRMLIETLWNTGARINEALALTPGDVFFNGDLPFVRLRTLKQRAPGRGAGRPRKSSSGGRLRSGRCRCRMRDMSAGCRAILRHSSC